MIGRVFSFAYPAKLMSTGITGHMITTASFEYGSFAIGTVMNLIIFFSLQILMIHGIITRESFVESIPTFKANLLSTNAC